MKTIQLLIPFVFGIFLNACAGESPIDCTQISVAYCASKGCVVQTGYVYDVDVRCNLSDLYIKL
jgi:hypothetical protein